MCKYYVSDSTGEGTFFETRATTARGMLRAAAVALYGKARYNEARSHHDSDYHGMTPGYLVGYWYALLDGALHVYECETHGMITRATSWMIRFYDYEDGAGYAV